jgi:hypothetical protein
MTRFCYEVLVHEPVTWNSFGIARGFVMPNLFRHLYNTVFFIQLTPVEMLKRVQHDEVLL